MLCQRRVTCAAVAFVALSGGALGQTPPASSAQDNPRDRVIVTGKSTEEAIRDFVGEIAASSSKGQNQMARWDRRICPGLMGVQPQLAQSFVDRIAQRAVNVGLDIGDPGCKANILIIVSLKPDDVARELYDKFGSRLGRYKERGVETLGRAALEAFVASDAPVRWWHVSNTVTRDGHSLAGDTSGSDNAAPVNQLTTASRITRSTRQDFASAFIIVDAHQMKSIDFNALADYLAMVALAQLDSDADATGAPSILNLFAKRDAAQSPMTAMTDWDVSYLRGLYSMERESGSAARQERSIADTIAKDLAKDGATGPAPR